MKVILTEEQYEDLNLKIIDKFIDMLVKQTRIFGGRKYDYRNYDYVGHISFPHSDNSYDLAFNNPYEFTFTSPARYGLKEWFSLIGIDMDEEPKKAENLWRMYLDRVEVKVKNYIKDFIENEN